MALLLHPAFFAPVIQYVAMAGEEQIVFEKEDNFQKQTYRNRCYIYGANGKQLLTVPIRHSRSEVRQKTKDLRIDNSFPWKKNVVKSLESSYRSSPYFEFYEDEIIEVFDRKHEFLMDLNLHAGEVVADCLQLERSVSFTDMYEKDPNLAKDYRYLIEAKGEESYPFESYTQVFGEKHGFLNNLSILDLLFNEGTNSHDYLLAHRHLLGS